MRLIDADALKEELLGELMLLDGSEESWGMDRALIALDNAPTIVEKSYQKKQELKVYPCAKERLAKAVYDPSDNTIVLFDQFGLIALGYIKLDEVKTDE